MIEDRIGDEPVCIEKYVFLFTMIPAYQLNQ